MSSQSAHGNPSENVDVVGALPPRRKARPPQCLLDALAPAVLAELERRLNSTTPYEDTRAWLRAAHGVFVSQTVLSQWRQRRLRAGSAERPAAPVETVEFRGFEISVHAPGASEIRLRVRPLSEP